MKRIGFMKGNSNMTSGGLLRSIAMMLGVITLVASAAMDVAAQEKRGRMVNTARLYDAQKAQASERREDVSPEDTVTAMKSILEVELNASGHFDTKTIRIDVAENALRFKFDETPLHPDGMPAYGNEFVTEGYIYPRGTLNGTDGVNPDGTPEFPKKVIGRWTCRGWHVGEGAKTLTGPWVITHQLFDFGDEAGRVSIATDGVELVDFDVPVMRAIIGGTGQYANARGEARQTMIGFNQLLGVNLRLELRVDLK